MTIKPGWNMLAVNFKDVTNKDGILLNDLFLGTGDAATCPFHADINLNTADNIQIFDAATQGYTTYYLYYTTKTTSAQLARKYRWNTGSSVATTRLHNGDAMWFLSRSASDVQMNVSGEVELAAVSNITIRTGWNMIGSFFPDGWKVNDDASGYTQEFWENSGAHADINVNTADNIQVFAAAIVCAAVVGQAAAVSWACDWAYSNNGTTINTYDAPDEMTYWIVNMGSSTDTSGLSVDGSGALVNKDGYGILETGTFQENGGGITPDGTVANGNYLAMVIYDAANSLYGVSDANIVSGIVVDPPTAGDLAVSFQNDGGAEGYLIANTAKSSVPEPTSGLMLLLGVAGLALRRGRRV